MKLSFRGNINFVSFFGVCKPAQTPANAVNLNKGYPSIPVLNDAHVAVSIVFSWAANILDILRVRNVSKVGYAVIRRLAVDVVDFVVRPFAVDIKPRKPVRPVLASVHPYGYVAFWVGKINNWAKCNAIGSPNLSAKDSSIGVVIQKFAQAFCGKICFSHVIAPFQRCVGEKPDSVGSGFGLRYFNIGAK
jgi:hypothetical protein